MVAVNDFLARFVKFQGFDELVVQAMLDESTLFFAHWENETAKTLAIMLLTAHNLELEQQTILDSSERLLLQREGESPNTSNLDRFNYYNLTRYGMQLKDLMDSLVLGMELL